MIEPTITPDFISWLAGYHARKATAVGADPGQSPLVKALLQKRQAMLLGDLARSSVTLGAAGGLKAQMEANTAEAQAIITKLKAGRGDGDEEKIDRLAVIRAENERLAEALEELEKLANSSATGTAVS